MNAIKYAREKSEEFSIQQAAREEVQRWSARCQEFLDWQRKEILDREPSKERLEQHRTALKWLLRFARAVHPTAADPDYPDRSLADELEGRLAQLQESWAMVHQRIPDAEADALLREVFPE